MTNTQLTGTITALVTPMNPQGGVAWDDLERLVNKQIEEGIDGLVAMGTTGESPTLDHGEHLEVVKRVIAASAGRVPVIAGTGSNSTTEAVEMTRAADRAGADAFLQVAPYYNKPSQEGLFRHFSAVAEITEKPIVLYSIPGRCGIQIGVDTTARLGEAHANVRWIKEAGGTPERVSELVHAMGEAITVLSGDDSLTLPFISVGAKGVISVASNLIAPEMTQMVRLANEGAFAEARAIHRKYFPLFKALFCEPNPVPVKHAMQRAGLISCAQVRLPLCELTTQNTAMLDALLAELGL